MRKMPAQYAEFLDIAIQEKLTCPEGRALYACNRVQNGGLCWTYETSYSPLSSMKHARESTAKRWLDHWNSGGSIRSISLSQIEWNAKKCKADKEYREYDKLHGIK